jgi:hypothetical protein
MKGSVGNSQLKTGCLSILPFSLCHCHIRKAAQRWKFRLTVAEMMLILANGK